MRTGIQAGLSNRFCPSVIKYKKIFITRDFEVITISKWEVNDELRHILAHMYLMKHKAVLFSAFSTFF